MDNPDATLPYGGIDTRQWFAEEEHQWRNEQLAKKYVDVILDGVERRVEATERRAGIQSLKQFLGTPDALDETLMVFCYGRTFAERNKASKILLAWVERLEGGK